MITKTELDELVTKYETVDFIKDDPVQFVHRFSDKKDVEMVFERFFTSDKSKTRQTTGLGLCISKMLVEKNRLC